MVISVLKIVKALVFFCCVILFFSCKSSPNEQPQDSTVKGEQSSNITFADKIEQRHKKLLFDEKQNVKFNFLLNFGGKERFNGVVTSDVYSNKASLLNVNGDSIYVDAEKVYLNKEYSDPSAARFQAYTWTYFFLLPYKLNDPGTIWEDYTPMYDIPQGWSAKKLKFKSGVGDTSDDWYIVFADQDMQIQYVSYIVTSGRTKAEAEASPSAIVYKNYKDIQGVPVSHNWEFRKWEPKKGLGDVKGHAKLDGVVFSKNESYTVPLGFELKQ